jgi:hypothetical protein
MVVEGIFMSVDDIRRFVEKGKSRKTCFGEKL